MPAEEGRRGDEEGHPAVPQDHPTGRGEEDPVDGPELGWAGPPTKDPKLVTEDQDLEVLGAVISATLATANEETDEGADDEVQEREHRLIVRELSKVNRGFRPPRGEPRLEVAQLGDLPANLGSLGRQRPTKIVGHLVAVAVGAEGRETRSFVERQIELSKAEEQAKPVGLGRAIVAIAARLARWAREQPLAFVEPNALGRGPKGFGECTDPHGRNRTPYSRYKVKPLLRLVRLSGARRIRSPVAPTRRA